MCTRSPRPDRYTGCFSPTAALCLSAADRQPDAPSPPTPTLPGALRLAIVAPAATARRQASLGALPRPLCRRPEPLCRPPRISERGALRRAWQRGPHVPMHVHAPQHLLTLTNLTVTGRTLHLPRAYTQPDACKLACRILQATRPPRGHREATAKRCGGGRHGACRAVAAAAGCCTAAPAAADRPAVSLSTGGVRAERGHLPHHAGQLCIRAACAARRHCQSTEGCARSAARGAPQVPGAA